jgi:hypothetical protein
MPMFKRGCVVLLLIVAWACGNSSPSAPSSYASVAGNWSGMYQGLQLGLPIHQAIVMNLTQAGSSVNGTWTITNNITSPQASNFYSSAGGTLFGTTSTNGFSGTFTINAATTSGAACSGTFAVSGNAGGSAMTWTSPGATGSCTNLPLSITITVQN